MEGWLNQLMNLNQLMRLLWCSINCYFIFMQRFQVFILPLKTLQVLCPLFSEMNPYPNSIFHTAWDSSSLYLPSSVFCSSRTCDMSRAFSSCSSGDMSGSKPENIISLMLHNILYQIWPSCLNMVNNSVNGFPSVCDI